MSFVLCDRLVYSVRTTEVGSRVFRVKEGENPGLKGDGSSVKRTSKVKIVVTSLLLKIFRQSKDLF